MSNPVKLCSIRKEFTRGQIDLSEEIVEKEVESEINRLNNLRSEDLVDKKSQTPALQVNTLGSSSKNTTFTKNFYFTDVELNEDQNSVEVVFSDGHREVLQDAEIASKYPTLNPSDYGPSLSGEYQNQSTGTVHLVDHTGSLVCGRDDPDPSEIRPVDTVSNTYRQYCSQCSHSYDGLITRAADLSIQLR